MNIEMYHERRKKVLEQEQQFREVCEDCFQPKLNCYCHQIQKINTKFKFVILIHPIEARRRIATGRMSHLCLENSHLIRGHDFTNNKTLNALLADPKLYPVILYPGQDSKNLTHMPDSEKTEICPPGKTLTIFVIDGTWATAKKMLKHSQNLKTLPRICFSPDRLSNFRIRKQPHEGCFSTIEAIHHTIELLGASQGFDITTRAHDGLLRVFDWMVDLHLDFIKKSREKATPSRYRSVG